MSSNKGKDGEMNALITFATIGKHENKLDLTRPTTTNTADMGADIILVHEADYIDNKMIPISQGKISTTTKSNIDNTNIKTVKTRIDIKTTDNKLQKDTMEKFISDVRKHPDCKNHILMGGLGLTSSAKKILEETNEKLLEDNKKLYYVNNHEVQNIHNHYTELENKNKS